MTEIEKILLTSSATIAGAVFVVVVGQIAIRFVIKPWQAQRMVIGRIAEALLNNAHLIVSSEDPAPPGVREASDALRRLSTELLAKTMAIGGYGILSVFRCVPRWRRVTAASRGLFGIGNTLAISRMWDNRLKQAVGVARDLRFSHIDSFFSKKTIEPLEAKR